MMRIQERTQNGAEGGLNREFVARLLKEARLIDAVRKAGYPENERTCDELGEKYGLGAEHIIAISKALKEQDAADDRTH